MRTDFRFYRRINFLSASSRSYTSPLSMCCATAIWRTYLGKCISYNFIHFPT